MPRREKSKAERLYDEGCTTDEIAKSLNLDIRIVLDLIRPNRKRLRSVSDFDAVAICDRYNAGEPAIAIADGYGISFQTVYCILARFGVKAKVQKATEEQERRAVELAQANASFRVICRETGLKKGVVARIIRREKEITGKCGRHRSGHYALNDAAFANAPQCEEAAFFCGLWMTDGCIVTNPCGGQHAVLGTHHRDAYIHWRLQQFLGTNKPARVYMKESPNGKIGKHVVSAIYSPVAVADLIRWGVTPRKTHTACPHPDLANNPHFIRGCLDGDGCVSFQRRPKSLDYPVVIFVSASEAFAECVRAYFVSVAGSGVRLYSKLLKSGTTFWTVNVTGNQAVDVLEATYGNCTIALPRKLAKAQMAIASRRIILDTGQRHLRHPAPPPPA